jgi:hypothetical protein
MEEQKREYEYLLIRPDATMERRRGSQNGGELQEAIGGGPLECVALDRAHAGYLDEEGKLKGFPVNPVATELWKRLRGLPEHFPDTVNGNFLICGCLNEDGENDGYDYTVSDEVERLAWLLCIECRIAWRAAFSKEWARTEDSYEEAE